jgi:hypothetical protein
VDVEVQIGDATNMDFYLVRLAAPRKPFREGDPLVEPDAGVPEQKWDRIGFFLNQASYNLNFNTYPPVDPYEYALKYSASRGLKLSDAMFLARMLDRRLQGCTNTNQVEDVEASRLEKRMEDHVTEMAQDPKAFFVQIGAHAGNTWNDPLFRLMHGSRWSGVAVEPVPWLFSELERNYEQLQRGGLEGDVALENAAICLGRTLSSGADASAACDPTHSEESDEPSTATFYAVARALTGGEGARIGLYNTTYSQLGSLDRSQTLRALEEVLGSDAWTRLAGGPEGPDAMLERVPVQCLTYRQLLTRRGRRAASLVQVDAEGADYGIVRQILEASMRTPFCADERVGDRKDVLPLPRVLQFELHAMAEAEKSDVLAWLDDAGYACIRIGGGIDAVCSLDDGPWHSGPHGKASRNFERFVYD